MRRPRFSVLALSAVAPFCQAAAPALHEYTDSSVYVLDQICTEASGVTYNPDTDSLFVIGDEGANIIELDKTGHVKSSMQLLNFDGVADPEGITYLGNGQYMLALERTRRGYILSYDPKTYVTRINNTGPIFTGNGDVVDNIGLEGVCYDSLTNTVWGVKEREPLSVYQMTNFASSDYSVTSPFPGSRFSRVGATSTSDLFIMANSKAFAQDDPRRENILFLCRDDQKILEMTRTGTLVDTLDLSPFNRPTIEGITMDNDGVIYLVSEEIVSAGEEQHARMIALRTPSPAPLLITAQSFERGAEKTTASLSWSSQAGSSYVIEYSADLSSTWTAAGDPVVAEGATCTAVSQPVGDSQQGFFRVRKIEP